MCGIFAVLNRDVLSMDNTILIRYFYMINHRGPDMSNYMDIDDKITFGFHRLAIMDPNPRSNQPLQLNRTWLICNGEIFNYKRLEKKYKFNMQTGSDCEIILHLYEFFGGGESAIMILLQILDAEFTFILYDEKLQECYAARDIFGIRPLFIGNINEKYYFASELKGISFVKNAEQFKPSFYGVINLQKGSFHEKRYYNYPTIKIYPELQRNVILRYINQILRYSVKARLMSDRPIGSFLSGGLDSSIITALVSEHIPNLECFSIGLNDNSYDIIAAKKVVVHLNANGRNIKHHIVYFTVEQGFNVLRDVIWHLESYDITTIRAGVCNYLLAKYIKENTDIVVLYSGSISDELFNGYQYGKMINDTKIIEQDSMRLLDELYLYDNLRDDRVTAAFGLELRVPFGNRYLANFIFTISAKYRLSNGSGILMEKMLLRDSFANDDLLPNDILYRRKEAFSNGIDSNDESWYQTLSKKYIEPLIDDDELLNAEILFPFNTPKTKESLYYRKIFEELYPGKSHIIPKMWLPPKEIMKEEIIDPSASILSCYKI